MELRMTKCLKYSLYIFNLLFFIMGFILLGVGIWAEVSIEDMEKLLKDKVIKSAAILLMVLGGVIIFLSLSGALAVKKEKRKILNWVCVSIVIVFALEVAGGLYVFTNRKKVRLQLGNGISDAVSTSYGGSSPESQSITKALDWIQSHVQCCGIDDPGDWKRLSNWHKISNIGGRDILVPPSCCLEHVAGCNQGTDLDTLLRRKAIYRHGCIDLADKFIKIHYVHIGRIGMAASFVQLSGMLLLFLLGRKLQKRDEKKKKKQEAELLNLSTNASSLQQPPPKATASPYSLL